MTTKTKDQYITTLGQTIFNVTFPLDPTNALTGNLAVYYTAPPGTSPSPNDLITGWILQNPSTDVYNVDLSPIYPSGTPANALVTITLNIPFQQLTEFSGNSLDYAQLNNEFQNIYNCLNNVASNLLTNVAQYIPNALTLGGSYPNPGSNTLPVLPPSSSGTTYVWSTDTTGNLIATPLTSAVGPSTPVQGDVTGTLSATYLAKMQSRTLDMSNCTVEGKLLAWSPSGEDNKVEGVGLSGDLRLADVSSNLANVTVEQLQSVPLNVSGITVNQVLAFNGTSISGTLVGLNGDLSGNNLSARVVGIQDIPVVSTPPTSGQVIAYNGTQYAPTSLSPGGAISYFTAATSISGYNVTSTTATVIPIPNVLTNSGSNFNSSTWEYTVSSSNDYECFGQFYASASAATTLTLQIWKNNSPLGVQFTSTINFPAVGAAMVPIASGIQSFSENDVLTLKALTQGGVLTNITGFFGIKQIST